MTSSSDLEVFYKLLNLSLGGGWGLGGFLLCSELVLLGCGFCGLSSLGCFFLVLCFVGLAGFFPLVWVFWAVLGLLCLGMGFLVLSGVWSCLGFLGFL